VAVPQIHLPPGLSMQTRIMILVWELTQFDGTKFLTALEMSDYLDRSEPYIKRVCETMTKGERAPLVAKDDHLTSNRRGRKAAVGYRLDDNMVIMPLTARLLVELMVSHSGHCVCRPVLVSRMASRYGAAEADINSRIDEAIRVGYIEEVPDNSLRGRERINREIDYLQYLANKVPSQGLQPRSPRLSRQGQQLRRKEARR
jgi:hypothetical protein